MNKKGQALVEFILILPVLLIIIISLIDIGNIYIKKYELNKNLEIVGTYYEKNKMQELYAYTAFENIDFSEENEGELKILIVKKNIKINAPILSNIIGRNYTIEAKKPILEDSHG